MRLKQNLIRIVRGLPACVAAVVVLLAAPAAFATEFHVLRDLDGDGLADPCSNAAHRAHYASDTASCNGGTVDIDGDGQNERIYCNLQTALNQATGPGDTVDIHAGTWDQNHSTVTGGIKQLCDMDNNSGLSNDEALAVVKHCSQCDSESDRRTIRAADMLGSVDSATLHPPTSVEAALVLGFTGTDNVRFVTIKDLTITDGVHWNSCDVGGYIGAISIEGNAHNLIVDGVDVDSSPSHDSVEECGNGGAGEVGPAAFAALDFTGRESGIDNITIRNSTLRGCSTVTMKANPSVGDCNTSSTYDHLSVHHNLLYSYDDDEILFEVKGSCNVAWYNNRIENPNGGALSGGKFRKMAGTYYIFNNFVDSGRLFQCQETHSSTSIYVFGNTINGGGDGTIGAFCSAANKFVSRNNSYHMSSRGVKPVSFATHTGYDHWTQAVTYTTASVSDSGHYVCNDSDACTNNNAHGQCSGSGGCNADDPGRPLSGSPPWRLQAGSPLVDAGTPNPMDQGAGACSISGFPGGTIDCTRDFDGDSRNASGAGWDIGADEFADGGGSQTNPGTVPNPRRTDSR